MEYIEFHLFRTSQQPGIKLGPRDVLWLWFPKYVSR
jgi:hypothetical protein